MLITGATGFVGLAVLARLLERTDRPLYPLVRAATEEEARARVDRSCTLLGTGAAAAEGRLHPLAGDLTRPDLGLGRRKTALARRLSHIVHCAALVNFDRPLSETREINVAGTRNLWRFAELCHREGFLERFVYVSTAYVCGDYRGTFSEDQLRVGQRFRNTYERSKFEAECFLRERASQIPLTVLRPSIVVGEQQTGWAPSFNALYWPLRIFAEGGYLVLPGASGRQVDVVPLDFVADSIVHLTFLPEAASHTFHLTAAPHAPTLGEIARLAGSYFGRRPPPLVNPRLYSTLIHPLLTRVLPPGKVRKAVRRSELFFPYFNPGATFDNRVARAAQRGTGIAVQPFGEYFPRLLAFAEASQWGRKQLPREAVVKGKVVLEALSR